EGVRYRFMDAPKVSGVRYLPHEELERLSKVKALDYYSGTSVVKDVNTIKDYVGATGRMARVEPVPIYSRESPGLVTVNYEVQEQQPARVGQIFIVGNERTRQNVILRQIPLFPGQV